MEQNLDFIVSIAIAVVMVASLWRIFVKAGKPGWAALIPYYNMFVLIQISKRPVWLIIFFIPTFTFSLLSIILDPFTLIGLLGTLIFIKPIFDLVALIAYVFVAYGLARAFGKGMLDTVLLTILAPIWYPIFAFDSNTYKVSQQQSISSTPNPQTPNQI
jgi:hypothetical protein